MSSKLAIEFYHASPKILKAGTILVPGGPEGMANFYDIPWVCLTTSPVPHYTISTTVYDDKWKIYRVNPLSLIHLGDDEDVWTKRACVSDWSCSAISAHRTMLSNAAQRFVEHQIDPFSNGTRRISIVRITPDEIDQWNRENGFTSEGI
ncbi:MAG: hypothetical protein WAZ18_05665 [Alphaproteobacteria bacterium]